MGIVYVAYVGRMNLMLSEQQKDGLILAWRGFIWVLMFPFFVFVLVTWFLGDTKDA